MAGRKRPQEPRRWRLDTAPGRGDAAPPTAGPSIAASVLAALRRPGRRGPFRLEDLRRGLAPGGRLAREAEPPRDLSDLHPSHAPYARAQNLMSVLSEQLSRMKEMAPFVDLVGPAEETYMPQGPPMSPLTQSFFHYWAYFDARAGEKGETIGTTVLALGADLGIPADKLRLFEAMQKSRMGVFVQEGAAGRDAGQPVVDLRELWSGEPSCAVVPAGHSGEPGELWFARVLPAPGGEGALPVVITTPYILRRPGAEEWRACIRRALPGAPEQEAASAYEEFMKFGPTPSYWSDFVFEGYAGHCREAIFLEGLPDDPGSRPCSAANDWGAGR